MVIHANISNMLWYNLTLATDNTCSYYFTDKITYHLLLAAYSGLLSLLLVLDRSAVFDTISYTILLNRLITHTPLNLFESYLSGRTRFIKLRSFGSSSFSVITGVPQGLVLEPLLFIAYLLPLDYVCQKYSINFYCYTDDTQLCLS